MIIFKSVMGLLLGIAFMFDGFSTIVGFHHGNKVTGLCAGALAALAVVSIKRLANNPDYIGIGVNTGIVIAAAIGIFILVMRDLYRSGKINLQFELQDEKIQNHALRQTNDRLVKAMRFRDHRDRPVSVSPNKSANK